ncbi:MAG: glycosyl transferase, partial [Chloroflexi bacterium]|nr:glycosyl transferase [Chloroflexota bacterium]
GLEGHLRLRDLAVPLGLVVALGLALRLIIAYVLLPGSGFGVDRASFAGWASELVQNGPFGLYGRDIFVDYTPGYLYVLWLLGLANQALTNLNLFGTLGAVCLDAAGDVIPCTFGGGLGDLMKLPAILADGLMAIVVCQMALELGARRRGALLAAGLVMVNPVMWFDSAIWAQVDAIGTVILLLAIRELWHGRSERAAILATIAAITKPQFGILIPIAAPFGLTIVDLLFQIGKTAGGYPYVTVNAYNPWALVSLDGAGLAANGSWLCDMSVADKCATWYSILGIPAVVWGTVALLATMGALAILAALRDRPYDLLVIMALAAVAFFIVPTRVHERYLYPFFAFGAVLAGVSRAWLVPYGVLATANFANLFGVLTWPFYENPGLEPMLNMLGGWGARLGEAIRSTAGVTATALAHVAGLVLVAGRAFLPRWAFAGAGELAGTGVVASIGTAGAQGDSRAATGGAGAPRSGGAPPDDVRSGQPADVGGGLASRHGAAGSLPVAREPAPGRGRSLIDWLVRPVVDRTVTLAREGGGRLDRMDLFILVVLVIATLTLRTFRLEQPSRMHFDEVYHARTATEFLQFWRYGEPHSIYEFTHPHLAKYLIAGGIVLWGDNEVESTSRLNAGVRDAAIEPRWDDPALGPDGGPIRAGERLFLVTGEGLQVHDLRSRALLADEPIPGAVAVAVDTAGHRAFVGTESGDIFVVDLALTNDAVRSWAETGGAAGLEPFAAVGGQVERLWSVADGAVLLAATPADGLVAIDSTTGAELGRTVLAGRAEAVDAGRTDALVARVAEIPDQAAAADQLAVLLGGEPATYEQLLASGAEEVTIASPTADERAAVEGAIAEGGLVGFSLESRPRVAVAGRDGITFIEPASLSVVATVELDAPATGLTLGEGVEDDPTLYAPIGTAVAVVQAPDAGEPSVDGTIPMPGQVSRAVFNPATELLHVLGTTPDGSAATVYVVEPRGRSVFADAALPFSPTALALDEEGQFPADDREQLLVFAADGGTAAVDTGSNAFGWRFPGALAGVLTAALMYLLARVLFRRRSVAVLAGVFAAVDGMLFVQSRIAMNDAYVAVFIMAAAVVFAALWTGGWSSRRAFWLAMPLVGVLLGLALASKWVALYAIGGFGILVLARSALGRVLLVIALAALAGVLGYQAIAPQENANWTFLLIMIALTFLAATLAVLRPVSWTPEEVRFAVAAPVVVGGALALVAVPLGPRTDLLVAGFAVAVLGGAAYVAFVVAGMLGWGPLAPPPAPDDPVLLLEPPAPPPRRWLRLGSDWGVPAAWMAVSLLAIPLVVYVVSYLPWVALGNQLWEGFPPGNTGQTLAELTRSMYDYHDRLRATHAASSPWWAWPLNLKPVWFFQGGYAGDTTGAIYDGGNLATWWLGVVAFAFGAWQAFRRRSLALAFLAIMIAALWLPWARIDRATFQYHYYAALPFVLLVVAYFVAEAWHGPSRRTWLLMRTAAAAAIMGPAILWLALRPLCAFVGVDRANPGSWACVPEPSLGPGVSWQALAVVFVLVSGLILVGWLLVRFARASDSSDPEARGDAIVRLVGALVGFVLALVVAVLFTPADSAFTLGGVPRELAALILALPLGLVAWVAFTAVSPRRWALGAVIAAALLLLVFWPNWTGLPLPDPIFNWYQLILPTWQYAFQFPVNMADAASVPLLGPLPALLGGAVLLASAFVAYAAWTVRLTRVERAAAEAEGAGGGQGALGA